MRVWILAPLMLAAGCAGGLQIPDFRTDGDRLGGGTPAVAVPTPAPAPAPTILTAKERLVAAIENNNCTLSADNVGEILNEATIGTNELRTLTAELNDEGRAEVAGNGTIRVISDRCAQA